MASRLRRGDPSAIRRVEQALQLAGGVAREAAEYLGVHERTLARWLALPALAHVFRFEHGEYALRVLRLPRDPIVVLRRRGWSVRAIAEYLGIGERTVSRAIAERAPSLQGKAGPARWKHRGHRRKRGRVSGA